MAACKFTVIARSFSSSGAQNQLVKTPIPVFGMGGRYASALYSAAVKAKEIDNIEPDLMKFKAAMLKDKYFSQIVRDPTIKKSQKSAALLEASKKLSLSKTSSNALVLIAENGRLKIFDQILMALKLIMAAHRGEIPCEVTSAKPLSDAQVKEIEAALKKFAKGKEKILLTTKVDPKIIGGLIVSLGDKYIDMSIASRIKKYTEVMQSVV